MMDTGLLRQPQTNARIAPNTKRLHSTALSCRNQTEICTGQPHIEIEVNHESSRDWFGQIIFWVFTRLAFTELEDQRTKTTAARLGGKAVVPPMHEIEQPVGRSELPFGMFKRY